MSGQASTLGVRAIEAVGKETYARQLALRRRILAVAKHRFARFGYDGVSLEDVAHSADVPLKELRLHFDDRLGLLRTVLEECWDAVNPRVEDIVLNATSVRRALLSILALVMNLLDKDEDMARLMLFEGRYPEPESGEMGFSPGYQRFARACHSVVERGQRHGAINPALHPQVITSMLMGAIEGVVRDRLKAEQESSFTPYTGSYLVSVFEGFIQSLQPEHSTAR